MSMLMMALLNFWRNSPSDVLGLRIVASAGDGSVKDNSSTSQELREYLKVCSTERLSTYAQQGFEKNFNGSGLVLQDVVNELGRRLEFEVENGLHQAGSGRSGSTDLAGG